MRSFARTQTKLLPELELTRSLMNTDDLIHFTLREWTRMSMSPGTAEVERAKSQLKASLLLGLDGSTAIAEDVSAGARSEGRGARGEGVSRQRRVPIFKKSAR